MEDAWGDGWNGAEYEVRDAVVDTAVATGTLDSGLQATDDICLGSGGGCYSLRVTGGDFPDEVSWTFGTMSGGAPYARRFFFVVDGSIEGPFQSCPTPTPTVTFQPTLAPTLSLVPSVSPAPSTPPTPVPTLSPTTEDRPFEARTWDELNGALRVDHAMVNVTADITFTDRILLVLGQDVTAFCDSTTTDGISVAASYCATLGGGGETSMFRITNGACLRLIGLRITNGYGEYGVAFYLLASEIRLTGCTVDSNHAVCRH